MHNCLFQASVVFYTYLTLTISIFYQYKPLQILTIFTKLQSNV